MCEFCLRSIPHCATAPALSAFSAFTAGSRYSFPEAKRQYGYYVFPVLQGDRMIGRLDAKRAGSTLLVRAFWPEAGVRMGKARSSGLEAELS